MQITESMRLSGIALVLVLFSAFVRAEDRISVGYGEGLPGARNVAVPITTYHDLPIHGYSLAISYPRESLRLLQISALGTATEEVGVDFFFEGLDDDAGTATLGAIFAFNEPYTPSELPATVPGQRPQLLAWLIFDVPSQATAGEHPIQLVDGLGDPPISNRFTYRGTTIRPVLDEGVFLVQSENVLTLDSKFGLPGFRLAPMYAYARHPQPLQGFQVAISFDPRALNLEEATFNGTSMLSLLGGKDKIEFSQIKWQALEIVVSPTEWRTTAGVIFDYLSPYNEFQVLPPQTASTTSQSIMKYSFQPKSGADQFGESSLLALSDSAAPDAVKNVFIIGSTGGSTSVEPRKVDGRIYYSTGFLTGTVVDFKTGAPLSGATVKTDPGGATATTRADGSFRIGGEEGIPPGSYSVSVGRSGYNPGHGSGEVIGKGSVADVGTVALFPAPVIAGGFLRAEINGDTRVDISDGIYLLSYLFTGGTTPSCQDAADVNDDSRVDLSDAISLFGYLFIGGKVIPPPFTNCDQDPTDDALGCADYSGC